MVAYKQPVSRARVSAIRGVNVDGVMRTLLTRGLVEEAGAGPRRPARTSTAPPATSWSGSASTSIDELPELAPYLPDLADMEDQLGGAWRRQPHPETPEPGPSTEPDGGTEPT